MTHQVNGVNGEAHPSSATLSHITGYPVINDGIAYFKKNLYAQKSLALSDSAYQTFAKPFLPYLNMPYQYVSPYVKKADAMGDDALSKMDERIPVFKKSTDELLSDGKAIIFFPVRKGMETKGYVENIYNSEYKKAGREGLTTSSKALISTGLIVTSETLNWIGDMLRAGKAQTKETAHDASHQVSQ